MHWILEQWRRVFWSGEASFFFWQSDGRVWVWQLQEEQYLPDCIVQSVKFGGGGIIVWGCFSGAGIGPLVPGFSVQPGRTEKFIAEQTLCERSKSSKVSIL